MIGRRFRRFAVPLVVGVVALGLTGCDNRTSDAATVTFHDSRGDHTVHISRSDFTAELHALLANPQFAKALTDARDPAGAPLFPNLIGESSTDQGLSSRWLTTLVRQTVVDAEVEASHIQISPDDISKATADQQQTFSAPAFAAFSKSFARKLVDRDARVLAIYRYYQTCPSGRFVSHILLKTEAEATQALTLIRSGGASFAALAKAQSTDTTSGKAGGALGCLTPGQFVAPFQSAADAAPLDVVTGPVKTQFGYHLILVRRWDPVADRSYAQALTQAASAVLTARFRDLHVWINPQYGSWTQLTDTQGNTGFAVAPPSVPSPRVCREDTGCTPTTSTSTTLAPGG